MHHELGLSFTIRKRGIQFRCFFRTTYSGPGKNIFNHQATQFWGTGYLVSVYQDLKASPSIVFAYVLIPYYSDDLPLVVHIIQTKPIPGVVGQHGINLKHLIGTGSQSHQPGNHQIVKGRMIIISTSFLVALQPIAGNLVEVLSDVRTPSVIL